MVQTRLVFAKTVTYICVQYLHSTYVVFDGKISILVSGSCDLIMFSNSVIIFIAFNGIKCTVHVIIMPSLLFAHI